MEIIKMCKHEEGRPYNDNSLLDDLFKPQLVWIEERIDALIAAMQRYQHASKPIPIEWTNELWSHTNWLKNNK